MLKKEQPNPVILYADDHRDAHALLKRAFENAGLKVVIMPATDGTEVLQYLSNSKEKGQTIYPWPTLLLLDLNMPKLSGFEVLQTIKNSPEPYSFPVVIFTSSEAPADIVMAKKLGYSAFVKKQFELDKLVRLAQAIDVEFFGGEGAQEGEPFSNFCAQ
jgi:CheY-like chemotaxis protein